MTPAQIRAAKAMLGWSSEDVAKRAGLSRNTVQAMQAKDNLGIRLQTTRAVRQVLEEAGIKFIKDRETRAVGVMMLPPEEKHDATQFSPSNAVQIRSLRPTGDATSCR